MNDESEGEFDPNSLPPTPWINDPRLEFGEPRHGWLPVKLTLGEYELAVRASHVLNDPVEEFIDWGAFVRDGVTGFRRVFLWLEPAAYAVDVRPPSAENVYLNVWHEDSAFPPWIRSNSNWTFQAVVSRRALYNQVVSAVTQWLDRYGSLIPSHWDSQRNVDYYRRILPRLERRE